MDIRETIEVRDYHVAGRPVRLITGGVPIPSVSPGEPVPGVGTAWDRWRVVTMAEPRGHLAMAGTLVLPAQDPQAVARLLYMDALGYPTRDGAADVCLVTDLISTGRIAQPPGDSTSLYQVESPTGLNLIRVEWSEGRLRHLSYQEPLPAITDAGSDVCDPVALIAEGLDGRYALVPTEQMGISLTLDQVPALEAEARRIQTCLRAHLGDGVDAILFVGSSASSAGLRRQALVRADGRVDRSPLGGIDALLAWLNQAGQLQESEACQVQGLSGEGVTARIRVDAGQASAVIETRAFLVAMRRLFVDPTDPIHPFTLR